MVLLTRWVQVPVCCWTYVERWDVGDFDLTRGWPVGLMLPTFERLAGCDAWDDGKYCWSEVFLIQVVFSNLKALSLSFSSLSRDE